MEQQKYLKMLGDFDKRMGSTAEKLGFIRGLGSTCGLNGEQVKFIVSNRFTTDKDRCDAVHAIAQARCCVLKEEADVTEVLSLTGWNDVEAKLDMLEHLVRHGRIENPTSDLKVQGIRTHITRGGRDEAILAKVKNILSGQPRGAPRPQDAKETKPKPEPPKPKEPSHWDKLSPADQMYCMEEYKKTGLIPIESICKMYNCSPEKAAQIQESESKTVREVEAASANFAGGMMGGMSQMSQTGMQGQGMPQMGGGMHPGMQGMPQMGMQGMPQTGMPQAGMQGMPQMGGGMHPGMQGMPQMGMQGMPQMGMQGMPQMGGGGMPQMGTQGMPQAGMPQAGMQGMLQTRMQGMPQKNQNQQFPGQGFGFSGF